LRNLILARNEIAVWVIDLASQEDRNAHYYRLLSRDEVERAHRFHFERDRMHYTVARAAMRQILGRYTGQAPQEVVFAYGPKGKPELFTEGKECHIKFNLSHSAELAVLAVSQGMTVGVDIESIDPSFATQEIAERFFSVAEVNTLRALPASEKAEAFFSCWTRKEAYIKALGEGLAVPLNSFAVAFGPDVSPALLHVAGNPAEVLRWSIYDVETIKGYKAALVAEGSGQQLRRFAWGGETS
jgi:4'-phosphopantetheinyl transferase